MAPFLSLVFAALQAITQVMVLVLSGFALARAGYFDPANQKWLSKLNLVFFTPCLLFTKMAPVISMEKFLGLWPIPVIYFLFAGISWIVAQIGSRILRLSEAHRRFVTACIVFSNTNSLPIAIIQSLAFSKAGEVLYWGADDTMDAVAARGISYILFFAIFGNILRWSYGYNLLKNPTKIDSDDKASFANPNTHNASVEQGWTRDTELKHYAATSNPSNAYTSQSSLLSPRPANERSTLLSPRPADERSTLLAFPRFPHDNDDTPPHSLRSHPYVARLSYLAHHLRTQIPPPLYAAFLALIVGLTPPLKRLFFDPSSFLQPSFTTAIISCGATAVPLIMICLGAQMNELLSASRSSQPATVRPVALVIVARMLITPLYIIPVVALFAVVTGGEGHMSAVVADPVFLLVLILLGCAPTAVNLVQICQVHDVFEEEMTRVLFWSYGIVAVPVTIVVMVALVIVQLVT